MYVFPHSCVNWKEKKQFPQGLKKKLKYCCCAATSHERLSTKKESFEQSEAVI